MTLTYSEIICVSIFIDYQSTKSETCPRNSRKTSRTALTGEPKIARRVMGKADRHPSVEAKNAVQSGTIGCMTPPDPPYLPCQTLTLRLRTHQFPNRSRNLIALKIYLRRAGGPYVPAERRNGCDSDCNCWNGPRTLWNAGIPRTRKSWTEFS
jgi:hypothetical protein